MVLAGGSGQALWHSCTETAPKWSSCPLQCRHLTSSSTSTNMGFTRSQTANSSLDSVGSTWLAFSCSSVMISDILTVEVDGFEVSVVVGSRTGFPNSLEG